MPLTLCGYFIDNYQIQIFGVAFFNESPRKHRKSTKAEGQNPSAFVSETFGQSKNAFYFRSALLN